MMRKLQNKLPFLVGEISVQTVPVATGALHSQAGISWSFLDRISPVVEGFFIIIDGPFSLSAGGKR